MTARPIFEGDSQRICPGQMEAKTAQVSRPSPFLHLDSASARAVSSFCRDSLFSGCTNRQLWDRAPLD
jgi:hypothetical protein